MAEFDHVIEQHHHLGDVERPAAGAADRIGGKVVGDTAGLECGLDAPERLDHFRPQIAGQQRQYVLAADFSPQRQQLRRKQPVEGLDIHLGPFEFRPGVLQMIGCVGAADDVGGQAALGLEASERLKRRGRQYAAKVPDYRFQHRFPAVPTIVGKPLTWQAGLRQSSHK